MFNKLKKKVIIEYLIKEIDKLEPKENIYKEYINNLLKICNIEFINTESLLNKREEFISLVHIIKKKNILDFCRKESFIIEIELVEYILDRVLLEEDYDENNVDSFNKVDLTKEHSSTTISMHTDII